MAAVTRLRELGFELFELLPDAILAVDRQGIIRYANRQAGRLFGQDPATLVSAPIETLVPEQLRERHIANRAKFASEPHLRPMGAGLDLAARRADGTTFPVDIMLNPLQHFAEPMTLAVVRDMTKRRAAEEAVRQSRTMFETLYEQSPDAIIVVDETGKIDRVNAPAEMLFGFSRERMLGQPIEMLLPERLRDVHSAHRATYMKKATTRPMGTSLQLAGLRVDGSEFPVDIMLSPITIERRRLVLAVVRDVTERKRVEAQMQLLLSEVNHRAKNMLGLVRAMARQTQADCHQEFLSRFDERIEALSASQDLLVDNKWQNIPLRDLVRSQRSHFSDLLESRIAVRGPDLRVTAAAAQVIGMALHELATNAGKYGALSNNEGHVDIVWHLDRADGQRFSMEWRETGGPIVIAPTRHGFGWTVLCQLTKAALEADVMLEYALTGVVWGLGCPPIGFVKTLLASVESGADDILPTKRHKATRLDPLRRSFRQLTGHDTTLAATARASRPPSGSAGRSPLNFVCTAAAGWQFIPAGVEGRAWHVGSALRRIEAGEAQGRHVPRLSSFAASRRPCPAMSLSLTSILRVRILRRPTPPPPGHPAPDRS